MTETIWNWCAVVIHAVASTVQSVILGPICFAFEVATNALFAVLIGILKTVKLIVLQLFRAFRIVVGAATTFVLCAAFGSFFPSLREARDGVDVEYEASRDNDDADDEYEYESEDNCESDDDFYNSHDHVATPATLRFLAPLYGQGKVDYRSY
jgi:hypothetical protein